MVAQWPRFTIQYLYNLNVTFTSGEEFETKTTKVSFRIILLEQDELEQCLSFTVSVNGYPIFAKGANVVLISILPEKGQNSEIVENNTTDYQGCEYGILIWQDFMFVSTMYPADSNYLSNVGEEFRHQIKCLGSHPWMALWSGNTANELILSQNWYKTTCNFSLHKNDYIKLYIDVIKSELTRILPWSNMNYVTSTPGNRARSDLEGYVAVCPADPFLTAGLLPPFQFHEFLQHMFKPVKVETEHYRSFKGHVSEKGQANSMGTLYRQLNDVWEAPTWSGMGSSFSLYFP
ncbi:hypothetical protein BDFB_004167 [Asbolus verrucosus]|uniref:Uncharacterized protein n=1 Tax=Asbolus verrucosus TaxID=1661398 RepID=A0A482WA59_ASBVE|nr:hypothetical protein BDFB_004167 [Asbolus verrucosus]